MTLSNSLTIKGPFPTAGTITSTILSSATVAAACVGHALKSGTVDRALILKTTAGVGGNIAVRFETLTNNMPSGTLLAAGADGNAVIAGGSNSVQVVTLNTPVTVTRGDLFACLTYLSTFVASTSVGRAILSSMELNNHTGAIPGNRANATFTVGSGANWAVGTANTIGMICPIFTDGTPVLQSTYMLNAALPSYTTIPVSGAGAYYGVRYIPELTGDLEYIYDQGRSDNALYQVYDNSNTLLGTSRTMGTIVSNLSNVAVFATPIRLVTGQTYRIVKRSTSGTNTLLIMPSYSQVMQEAIYGIYQLTSSADGITWTDTVSTVPCITLGISPVSTSSGFPLSRVLN